MQVILVRMARHDGKLNLSFIDGHLESLNGNQLLSIGNSVSNTDNSDAIIIK